jgi:hypothetical protein
VLVTVEHRIDTVADERDRNHRGHSGIEAIERRIGLDVESVEAGRRVDCGSVLSAR